MLDDGCGGAKLLKGCLANCLPDGPCMDELIGHQRIEQALHLRDYLEIAARGGVTLCRGVAKHVRTRCRWCAWRRRFFSVVVVSVWGGAPRIFPSPPPPFPTPAPPRNFSCG